MLRSRSSSLLLRFRARQLRTPRGTVQYKYVEEETCRYKQRPTLCRQLSLSRSATFGRNFSPTLVLSLAKRPTPAWLYGLNPKEQTISPTLQPTERRANQLITPRGSYSHRHCVNTTPAAPSTLVSRYVSKINMS